ncbi:MAG: LysE family transporter, partial [Dehalococcoides mccartyi]
SGAAMSALNPFFLVWWATVGAMLVMKVSDYGLGGLGALAATHWLVDLAWLCLVSFIVYRTHRLWGSRVREIVFTGCGLLLAAFGVYFIVSGLKLWL